MLQLGECIITNVEYNIDYPTPDKDSNLKSWFCNQILILRAEKITTSKKFDVLHQKVNNVSPKF